MAFKVMIVLGLALAAVLAAEEPKREKKQVFAAYGAYPYAYDDGSYYPGKYEKTSFYSGAIPYAAAAVTPYAHAGVYPYPYAAYPYHY